MHNALSYATLVTYIGTLKCRAIIFLHVLIEYQERVCVSYDQWQSATYAKRTTRLRSVPRRMGSAPFFPKTRSSTDLDKYAFYFFPRENIGIGAARLRTAQYIAFSKLHYNTRVVGDNVACECAGQVGRRRGQYVQNASSIDYDKMDTALTNERRAKQKKEGAT